MSSSLDGLRLKKAVATLLGIEQHIKERQKWMATLMSFKDSIAIDARDLLDISNKVTRESMALEITIKGLAAEAKSLARSMPTMPPKQLTMGKYTYSSAGELKQLNALAERMPKQMAELRHSLDKFRAFATRKINDPTRTSDGQADPLGILLALADLLVKARKL